MQIGHRIHCRSASKARSPRPAILAGNGCYKNQLPNQVAADTARILVPTRNHRCVRCRVSSEDMRRRGHAYSATIAPAATPIDVAKRNLLLGCRKPPRR
jgi:hypothetical protein